VDSGNLTDAKVYVCPSSTTQTATIGSDGLPDLAITTVSYAYIPGLDATSPGDSGVAADGWSTANTFNHTDYGNILFADGHVTPSTGTTTLHWINKANWYVAPTGGAATWKVGGGAGGPQIL
jgi:prepilin-type processing-associated H-X9-DG protein